MTRPAIALLSLLALVLGCGSKAKDATTTPGRGSNEPAIMAKKISLSWGFEVHGETTDVFLATTDETGKQISHSIGAYKGTCAPIKADASMNAMVAVACKTGPTGTELHAVVQGGDAIVIMQLGIDQGVKPDPMAREEVTRIKVPLGVQIEAGT